MLKIAGRLASGLAIAILFLLLAEGGLRIADYRGPSAFEDPYLGFEGIYPLFDGTKQPDGRTIFTTNPGRLRYFNRQEFQIPKPPGVFRIFCFGGSTTYGRPLAYQTAYPNWLEILLNSMDPSRTYEVINAGGISYASYRIVHLVEEARRYQPDLLIVYTGHNEFLERRTYGEILDRSATLRTVTHFMGQSRLYDLLREPIRRIRGPDGAAGKTVLPGEVDTILEHSAGLDLYSRDLNQAEQTFAHYRNNLIRMADIAADDDIPLIFVTPISNIADFSPFKSENRPDIRAEEFLAWEGHMVEGKRLAGSQEIEGAYYQFKAAYDIDPHHAELTYLLGRSALGLGRIPEAAAHLEKARDEDVCPLRAPGKIHSIILEAGEERALPVVDLHPIFRERSQELTGHPIPGNALFFDHLHPTIEGHQLIANQLAAALVALGHVALEPDWNPEEARREFDDLLNSLDDSYFAEGNLNLGKVLMWARKVREAFVPLSVAVERIPDNADAHYTMGICLSKLGKSEEAIESFRRVLDIDSGNTQARNNLALELRKTGDLEGAMDEFRKILAISPDNVKVLNNIGLLHLSSGNPADAEAHFRMALEREPESAETYHNLGLVGMANDDNLSAERDFRKALALRPNFMEAFHNLTVVLMRQDKVLEAREICDEGLRVYPQSPQLLNNLGEIYLSLGDTVSARKEFSRALSLRPGWSTPLDKLRELPSE